MLIVALTGGIGSGKSTVGQIFGDLGAIVTDSDQLARDVVERGTTGFDQIIAAFGDEVLKNGDLNRAALADLVFKDPAKRKQLEQITHPLIRKAFAKIVESANGDSIVVNQIPLLVESNHDYKFDRSSFYTSAKTAILTMQEPPFFFLDADLFITQPMPVKFLKNDFTSSTVNFSTLALFP